MTRKIHLVVPLFVVLAVVNCGQTATQDRTTTKPAPAAPGSSSATAPPVPVADDDDNATATADKFTRGAAAFATVKDTLLKNYYADGITEDDLYRAATAGMLEKLDPKMKKWNQLLTTTEMAELRNDLKGELVGIGAQISFDSPSGYADVQSVLPGSASERAGLVGGDKIVTVNGKLYKGMSVIDVVNDIRGEVGDPVTLSILRADKLLSFTITRERVVFDHASHILLADGLGYLQIPSFTEQTPAQVREALEDLAKQGPKALVLDLRQCPGGSFDSAVATGELLLPDGAGIVTLKKNGKDEEKHFAGKGKSILTSLPLAVLVSNATSSGAEFLTAALQEGRHARVIGKPTHGKWSVQSLNDLPNGYAFKYTVSLFKTPSGRSFEGTGLLPELEVAMDEKELARANAAKPADRLAQDVQLRTAKELLLRK